MRDKTFDYLFVWMQDKAHKAETAIRAGDKKEALKFLDILNTQLDILVTTATEEDNRHESNPD